MEVCSQPTCRREGKESDAPAETLEEDRHFMLLDALAGEIPDKSKRGSMSREVKRWYDEQGRSRHAARMALRVLPTFSSETMHD